MAIFDKLFPKSVKLSQEQLQLQLLLKNLSLKELDKISKEYISHDPKVQYTDSDGIIKTKKPNRNDYLKSILHNVSLEGVFKVFPELKNK